MPLTRGRRITIRVLLVAATILAILSIFALWANRQMLNADNWSDTSTQLLQDDTIRTQLASYLVDETYNDIDVKAELASSLPPQLAPLAGPVSGALRTVGERVANTALERPRVQQLWQDANRLTMQQFINIAEGNSKAITQSGNAVVLDLRVVLLEFVNRLGLPGTVADKIPASAGKIKIMDADQVSLLQDSVNAVRGLSVILPVLAFGFLGLAVFLARGNRRRTMMWAGIDLAIAGIIVLIGHNIGGNALLDSLVKNDAARPAMDNVWTISTGMLTDIAQSSIILGIPLILAAWLAGPSGLAVRARREAAPTLRDRPGVAYGVATFILLVIIAWGPIHATRLVIPVLLFFALTMIGVAALRRQTAEEFPEAEAAPTSPPATTSSPAT